MCEMCTMDSGDGCNVINCIEKQTSKPLLHSEPLRLHLRVALNDDDYPSLTLNGAEGSDEHILLTPYCCPRVTLWSFFPVTPFGADIESVDGSDARGVWATSSNPQLPRRRDAATDGSAPSVGTAPSRGNSPATSGSEGTNATMVALQVIFSHGPTRDDTWDSFLDVGALQTFTSASLVLTLNLVHCIWTLQRHLAEGKISKVCRSVFSSHPQTCTCHRKPL